MKGATTESAMVVVLLSGLPVIVTVAVPRVAVLVALRVSVLVQVGLHGLVVKLALTPLGRPEALSVTGWVVPARRVALIVLVPLVPCTSVRLVGEAPRL